MENSADPVWMIYVPCPNADFALRLSRTLVEEQLVACANVLAPMTSIYVWEKKLHEESEVLVIAKSLKSLWPRLQARVKDLHPYETPAILAYAAEATSPDFESWLRFSTRH